MASTRIAVELPPINGRHKKELAAWLDCKKSGIGGSSAAAAVGLGKFGSRLRLWAEMTGKQGFNEREESERMRWGNLLEQRVIEETARRVKAKLLKPSAHNNECPKASLLGRFGFKPGGQTLLRSNDRHWQHYSPDAIGSIAGEPVLIEAKTTSVWSADEWESDPPEHVYVQVHHGFATTGLKRAIVGVLIGGQELRVFDMRREEEVCSRLNELERVFMDAVANDVQPELENPVHPDTADVLKRLHPKDNGHSVTLPMEAVEVDRELELLKKRVKGDETRVEELKTRLKAWIGDATFGVVPGGSFSYSWRTYDKAPEEKPRAGYQYRRLDRKEIKP
jgi:predicted phage-related endonuclease